MNTSQTLLHELEGLFISEFRACQAIYQLTADERRALSEGDVARLAELTGHKENQLDKLSWLEAAKVDLLQQLDMLPDKNASVLKTLQLFDFLNKIDQISAQRLLRIQEGSLILRSQAREMTRGNRAMADSALKRTNSLQARLLHLYQLPEVGKGGEKRSQIDEESTQVTSALKFAAVFASLIAARDALQANDRKALSGAMEDLQQALEDLSSARVNLPAISQKAYPPEKINLTKADEAGLQGENSSLVETIANLYHQESAYQASLKVSNRMLAIT